MPQFPLRPQRCLPLYSYDDISLFVSFVYIPVSLGSLFQRIAFVYDRSYLPLLKLCALTPDDVMENLSTVSRVPVGLFALLALYFLQKAVPPTSLIVLSPVCFLAAMIVAFLDTRAYRRKQEAEPSRE